MKKLERHVFSDKIPGAQGTYDTVIDFLDKTPKAGVDDYSHGVAMLAQVILIGDEIPEETVEKVRERALATIAKYGDRIIDVMAPELKAALGIE